MKLYSFDLDKTLMPSGSTEIPQKIIDALNEILQRGDVVLYNSGRPFDALKNFVKRASKGKVFYSICNGSGVYDADENMIFSKGISHSYLIECFIKNPAYSVYSYNSNNEIIYFEESKYIDFEAIVNGQEKRRINIEDKPLDAIHFKLLFSSEPEIMDKKEIIVDKKEYSLIRTKANMSELMDIEVDKETAIKFVANLLNIDNKDIYAFGDADNDYLSIKNYNGATFSQGSKLCKEYAKYVSNESEDNWVIDALKYFSNNDLNK